MSFDVDDIHWATGFSLRQVAHTIAEQRSTLEKAKGRPRILNSETVDLVENFIVESREHRHMIYVQLVAHFELTCAAITLQRAPEDRGYYRHLAMRKPPISVTNRAKRLNFAQAHLYWTSEQWVGILFTDETWVTSRRSRRI